MIKLVNLVGARPQFIKAAAITNALAAYAGQVKHVLVHSGQHYDEGLSDVFFEQLQLPEPEYYLDAPKATQVEQLAHIMLRLQEVIAKEKPDVLLLYGDTTTTLAGAITGAKMGVKVAHIEAGLRSYNNAMPEEQNRVLTDKVSSFLYVPTTQGMANLKAEGIVTNPGVTEVMKVGDVMLDCLRLFGNNPPQSNAVKKLLDNPKPILLVTLHRNFNADDLGALQELGEAFEILSSTYQIAFPVHPRTRKSLEKLDVYSTDWLLPPISYFDMLALEREAKLILTDSGGVQKEAYYFKKPLVILRPETEWVELVEYGVAKLCPVKRDDIINAVKTFHGFNYPDLPQFYGDGHSAEKICNHLIDALS